MRFLFLLADHTHTTRQKSTPRSRLQIHSVVYGLPPAICRDRGYCLKRMQNRRALRHPNTAGTKDTARFYYRSCDSVVLFWVDERLRPRHRSRPVEVFYILLFFVYVASSDLLAEARGDEFPNLDNFGSTVADYLISLLSRHNTFS